MNFNPLYDNKPWSEPKDRETPEIADKHDETILDKKLRRKSKDNRGSIVILHRILGGVIIIAAISAIGLLLYGGFVYAFL
jgi:hypothetical protein